MQNTRFRILLLLLLTFCLRSAMISAPRFSVKIAGTRDFALEMSSTLQKRDFPPYRFETQFELVGFSPERAIAVKAASMGVIAMLVHALAVLNLPENNLVPINPSYIRYFKPQHLTTVKGVLQTILAVLGAPHTENFMGCLRVPKMQLWHAWHSLSPDTCIEKDAFAYVSQDQQQKSYMVICNAFFEEYKRFDQVDCNSVVADKTIDTGLEDANDLPTASGSVTFLHELLHWKELTVAAGTAPIIDCQVIRLNNHVRTVAYRAFYSMKIKDPAWSPSCQAIQNADNYVFMVVELFYGAQCPNVLPWNDPPDSQLQW